MSYGEVYTAEVSGGLNGSITLPAFYQYGVTVPVNCLLDTLCVSVGNPGFEAASGQTVHSFAMLATADGDDQVFTLNPSTMAEVVFTQGASHPAKVTTIRAANLGFALAAETRYVIVCGHYTTGQAGSTSYTFTYSGTLLFR